jgi:hypothetical protein
MTNPDTCDKCGVATDFSKYAFVDCGFHNKRMCWGCDCPERGKACHLIGISNPEWILNIKSLIENE